jgi:hypothetical protein
MRIVHPRDATVMFQNDDIYTIDVNNLNMCDDPGYAPGQLNFDKFGMGFVSNTELDPCDKLYAHSWSGQSFGEGANFGRLGRMEATEQVGMINYDGGELTGTGAGRLLAFAGNPAKLVEYDKSDASVIDTVQLMQLNMPLTNAFAFYGGDFYLFTEGNNPQISKVTHYDYDAGVSTCVPLAMYRSCGPGDQLSFHAEFVVLQRDLDRAASWN